MEESVGKKLDELLVDGKARYFLNGKLINTVECNIWEKTLFPVHKFPEVFHSLCCEKSD